MIKIKFKKLKDSAVTPKRATAAAAGYDLYACFDEEYIDIKPNETQMIGAGIAIELPQDDLAAFIYARSGLAVKHSIAPANCVGVVDADYRGEICVGLKNTSDKVFRVNSGDRIAQMVIAPVVYAEFEEVSELSDTVRGEGGFGSTGVSMDKENKER